MKIMIFGGFLGSGKTSLLMPLAKHIVEKHKGGKEMPLVIIENEIGKVSIDDKTLQGGGFEVRGMFAGCICCTLVSGLNDAILEMKEKYDPEWVIIEATGLAYPYKIEDAIEGFLHISPRVVVVVDAARWEKLKTAVEPLMEGQIRNAHVLMLNKCDMVDEATLEKAKSGISALNPGAPLFAVSAEQGVDPAVLEAIIDGEAPI